MIEAPGILVTALAFVAVIGPLVFVHEMGHYLAGRWFGIKADAFSIGFGREILGFTDRRGTRWKLGWLPLGGYVRFAGDMNPASQPTAEWLSLPADERNRTFQAKPVWQRAVVVAAGPAINLLLAVLILACFALAYGDPQGAAVAGGVEPGSAAARAGLRPGDTVVRIADQPVGTFQDMIAVVQPRAGRTVVIDVLRDDEPVRLEAVVATFVPEDRAGRALHGSDGQPLRFGRLGITPAGASPLQALGAGIRRTGEIIGTMVGALGEIVLGDRSVKDLGGPLMIAKVSGEQMSAGVASFAFLLALISINLGFINLLPIPMLDGGHLLLYAIEAARRRPVEPHVQEWAFRGGLAALLALMLLVTFNDLGAFGLWKSLAGLIG